MFDHIETKYIEHRYFVESITMKYSILLLFLSITIMSNAQTTNSTNEEAILAAGCFWCVEAVFQELKGVESVESGYMGGNIENPTYQQVSSGTSGHAEVAKLVYNPTVVSFKEILEVFWKTHDPTTINQQGADKGPQYRSAIFYLNNEQKDIAEVYKKRLDESGAFHNPIATEITKASTYYPAEKYHQDYYTLNPNQGYCQYVIQPKVEKFRKAFAGKLKD